MLARSITLLLTAAMLITGCSERSHDTARAADAADAADTSSASGSAAQATADAGTPSSAAPAPTGSSGVEKSTAETSSTATPSADTSGAAQSSNDAAAAPNADASGAPASSATCPLVGTQTVEAAMHLHVATIEVKDASCTFHFAAGYHGDLDVTYGAEGGRDELDSVRKAGAGLHALMGGIAAAASAPPGAADAMSETPPPDVAKVGDDQVFMTEGPITQFYAIKGDAYVEVEGGFLADGVSRWVALPTVAQSVFQHADQRRPR